jgi:hypothetical protein
MLQAVRSVLAEAVSQVHASACALRLQARATVGFSFASAALVGLPGSSAGGGGRGGRGPHGSCTMLVCTPVFIA